MGAPSLVRKAGDQGVERALGRLEDVRVIGVQAERRPAVLQDDPCLRDHDVRAEAVEGGLDVADHHPVGVRGAQVHRVAACRVPRLGGQGLLADECAPRCRVLLGQQLLGRHRPAIGIGDVPAGVGGCQLHRLDLQVEAVHAVARQIAQVEPLEDVQGDQRREALPVGWELPDVVPAVAGADRVDPGAGVGRQVLTADPAPGGPGEAGDPIGELPGVERVGVRLGDQAQAARQVGAAPEVTHAGRRPTRGEEIGERRELLPAEQGVDLLDLPTPVPHRDRGSRVTAFGIIGGRFDQTREGKTPEALMQVPPRGGRARNGDGQPSVLRDHIVSLTTHVVRRQPGG